MIIDSPLSVRNNNPGNIRSKSGGFKKFGSPAEGLAATRNDLLTKITGNSRAMAARFGEDYIPTLRNLIATWAPESENDTEAYINHVAKQSGIDPDIQLAAADVDKILPAMIQMEGGDAATSHFTMNDATPDKADLFGRADELIYAGRPKWDRPPTAKADAILSQFPSEKSASEQLKDIGGTILRQTGQGASGGFFDEGVDAIAAGWASAKTGEPYDVLFDQARQMSKEQQEADLINHPYLSTGANVAGGVLTGAVGAGALKAVAPKAASVIATAAQSAPKTAALITGAGSGGIYGAGQGEGSLSDRLDDAGTGALWGGALGVPGYKLAQGVSNVAGAARNKFGPIIDPYISRGKQVLSEAFQTPPNAGGILDEIPTQEALNDILAPPQAAQPQQQISPMTLAGILDEEGLANLQQGKTIPLTRGDRTQDVAIQRMEQIAAESGSLPIQAARAQQQAAARKPFENVLGVDVPGDPLDLRLMEQGAAEEAANTLRGQFDALKARENAAWRSARETGEGVGINSQVLQDDLVSSVDNFLADNQYRTGDVPALDKHLGELRDIMSTGEGKAKTLSVDTKLKELEAWKTRLNSIIGDTPMDKKNTSRILKNIGRKYDDFMTNIADDAIVNGDENAIKAFKEARTLSKERFNFQDSDAAITRILDSRDLSGEQLVNVMLGGERLAGKGQSGRLVETMLKHAGDQAPEMREALKRGIMAKSFRRALTNTPDPADLSKNLISFDKMRNEIGNTMSKKEIFTTIFDENEQQYMRQLYDDLKLVAGKQKGAVNSSSTGAWTADLITGFGKVLNNPLFRSTPGLGAGTNALDAVFQKQAAAIVTGKAEKGLDEFIMDMIKNLDARPAYYGAISANAMGPDGIMRVTVTPSDKKEKR